MLDHTPKMVWELQCFPAVCVRLIGEGEEGGGLIKSTGPLLSTLIVSILVW